MPTTFHVHTSPAEIAALRTFWTDHCQNPNQDYAQFLEICRLRSNVETPAVVVAMRDGQVSALMVCRVERARLPLNLAYLARFSPKTRTLTVLHAGFLGTWDEETAAGLTGFLPQLFAKLRANLIRFNWLPEQHPVLAALRHSIGRCWRDSQGDAQKHWSMSIPSAPGELLTKRLKSKHRGWIKKKTLELEKAHPGRVTWRVFRSGDVLALFPELEKVAATTYQRALSSGFADTPEFRWMFENFNAQGSLRIYVMSVDGVAAGYWIGTVLQGTFHSMYTGYDPAFRDYELGTQIFVRMIDSLAEEGVPSFDFGLGDALYKQRFGDTEWQDVSLSVFRPSLTGLFFRFLTAGCRALRRSAEWVIARAGVVQKIKTKWRRRLQQKLPAAAPSTPTPAADNAPSPATMAAKGKEQPDQASASPR